MNVSKNQTKTWYNIRLLLVYIILILLVWSKYASKLGIGFIFVWQRLVYHVYLRSPFTVYVDFDSLKVDTHSFHTHRKQLLFWALRIVNNFISLSQPVEVLIEKWRNLQFFYVLY